MKEDHDANEDGCRDTKDGKDDGDGVLLECVTQGAGAVHDLYAHGEYYDGFYE